MANLHLCGCRPEAEDGRFPDLCPEHGRMKVSDAAAEIDRLREELSRAAVREGRMAQRLREAREAISTLPPESLGTGHMPNGQPYPLRDELVHYITGTLADPSPLAEAAQEVLEILLAFDAEGLDLTFDSEDQGKILRFRALLEGREEG